jgi:hypothetical protein
MKKIIFASLLFACLSFILVSCGDSLSPTEVYIKVTKGSSLGDPGYSRSSSTVPIRQMSSTLNLRLSLAAILTRFITSLIITSRLLRPVLKKITLVIFMKPTVVFTAIRL